MEFHDELSALGGELQDKSENASIAALEEQLRAEQDIRKEERFIWMIVALILFDALLFQRFDNWGSALSILVLELILVLVAAKWCGVEQITNLFERLIDAHGNRKNNTNS